MSDVAEMEKSPPPPPSSMETPRRAKKRQRRCACATAEACFACRRCLEQHCVCGAAQHASASARCRESRACTCRVVAPVSSRCELCMGCRQATGSGVLSHCRCVTHQQLWRARKDERKNAVGEVAAPHCNCFGRANVVGPVQAKERRRSITRVKRRAGLPSSRGIYANKIVAPSVGVDEFGEECVDGDSDESDYNHSHLKPTSADELEGAVHAVFVDRSRPALDGHMLQGPLSWSRSQPYQQAMAAPPTHYRRAGKGRRGQQDVLSQGLTIETADRSLANAVFERERDAALPPESLVDYLLFTASIKASRIPELIGSLDDTAATALAIVAEEYTKQLAMRSACEPLINKTKRSVHAFALSVLHDFNYAVYLQECDLPALVQLSVEQINHVVEDLAHLVYEEFMAVHKHRSTADGTAPDDHVLGYINEVVRSELESARAASTCESSAETAKLDLTSLQKLKAVTLSHHASKLTGQRVYQYEVTADVGGKHRAKVALDGFESREAAEQSIKRMQRVLESQDKRLLQVENPVLPPKVEDPIITELYEQLLNQVRQSRAAQQNPSSQSNGPSDTKESEDA